MRPPHRRPLSKIDTHDRANHIDVLIHKLKKKEVSLRDRCSTTIIKKLRAINELVGLSSLKEFVVELFYFHLADLPCDTSLMRNICITGIPGAGKSEVCTRIASLMQYIIFKADKPVPIISRADLVGSVLGETAMKTRMTLMTNTRRCIFLDEVYSLGNQSTHTDKDIFAKEALDTLCGFLSENPGSCMMIIAGYPNETEKCFFAQNPGLHRRFPWQFELPLYSPDELVEIFLSKLTRFVIKDLTPIRLHFTHHKERQAAEVMSLVNRTLVIHSKKVCLCKSERSSISSETLEEAIAKLTKPVIETTIPFMYT